MKVAKQYTVTVLPFRSLAVLTRPTSGWVNWLQAKTTCGVIIYDCTFQEAKHNLRILQKNYYIQKRRDSIWPWTFTP